MNKKTILAILAASFMLFASVTQASLVRLSDGGAVADLSEETSTVWEIGEGALIGQLLAAYNVNVSGTLYDVKFVDTNFTDVFGNAANLDASNFAEASSFSQALLDFVLLDQWGNLFDTDTTATNGCTITTRCYIHTPYEVVQQGTVFNTGQAANEAVNTIGTFQFLVSKDFSTDGFITFADWELASVRVSEPSTVILLVIGFCGLVFRSSRNKA